MTLLDTILLIGNADSDRPMLRDLFQNDYNILEAESVAQGLFLLEQNRNCIVAVIIDRPPVAKPEDAFLYHAHQRELLNNIPTLVITRPDESRWPEELAFSLGATDVITRPYPTSIMQRRIEILVDFFRSRRQLLTTMEKQAETLRHTNGVMVDALSTIIEYRSAESGSHILRIRRFTELLLNEVAVSCPEYGLTPETISIISSAAALHDIGKVSIPDLILNKPDRLTEDEMKIMRSHVISGSQMIKMLTGATDEEYIRYAYNICRHHHERWDGSGYPDGLSGDQIPICAQVVGLADMFDALTSTRVYKDSYPVSQAISMILNGDHGHFSPELLDCFKQVVPQLTELAATYAQGHSPKNSDISLTLPSPIYQNHELGSLQMARLKYQALLHYNPATVIELDMDHHTFHVAYNPTPNFRPIPNITAIGRPLTAGDLTNIHPDDLERTLKEYNFLRSGFFEHGLRRHTFVHRIFSDALHDYIMYQVTFLRLITENRQQHKALLIWHPSGLLPLNSGTDPNRSVLSKSDTLLNLINCMICRKNDDSFTLISGSGNLLDLLGYTSAEIETIFHNRFIELVLEEDQNAFRRHVTETSAVSTQIESEYRVRHKDGRILWILEKGLILPDESRNEVFYGSLLDNTASHETQAELEDALQLSRLIINQSDDAIFDWDIAGDHVQLSANWEHIFGYEAVPVRTPEDLSQSRIHPDDMDSLVTSCRGLLSGETTQCEVEIRIANKENRYLWCRMRLTVVRDSSGAACRLVGTLTNVDNIKRAYLALRDQAQRDSLTGLLNKAVCHEAIRSYLDDPATSACALLMIDLDNFKAVNDTLGHLFGDTVLTRTAQTIRRLFRENDIIGRVGGDEFMVLIQNVNDMHLIKERCDHLLSEMDWLFGEEGRTCGVTCSIGAALYPDHGTSFRDLFRHADHALYYSKQQGKHCCSIYNENLNLTLEQFSTPIESNDSPGLAGGSLVRAVFHQLSHSSDLERTIQDVLTLVGQQTNVSRIYIFENNDANTHCSNTFEWCNDGISPEIHNLQNISYETDIPGWEDNYDENGILFCPDITKLNPQARAILEPQGVKSMLHCAIREKGVFRGYIGLDECSSNRIWTQEQIDILLFLSEVVVSFLLKKRAQDKMTTMSSNLHSILNSQNSWMYVIDRATHQLLYINDKTRAAIPTLQMGDVCYRTIRAQEAPCADCPAAKATDSGFAKSLLYSPALGTTVIGEASTIRWNDTPACLITCRQPD